MKKFRGKRRYFRNLKKEQNLDAYDLDFSDDSWFDFWHTHLDFDGYGNDSLKIRKKHIKSLFILLNNLNEKLKEWGHPYQIWVEISSNDSASDAVFVHSINPNETNFPYKIPHLCKNDIKLPEYLIDVINLSEYMISSYETEEYDEFEEDDEFEEGTDKRFVIQPLNNQNYCL